MDRSKISFSQAEGLVPLPKQLEPKKLDKNARALIWAVVYRSFKGSFDSLGFGSFIGEPWDCVLQDYSVKILNQRLDLWENDISKWTKHLSSIFINGNYFQVFDILLFFLRHTSIQNVIFHDIKDVLEQARTAYRVQVVNDTPCIISISTEAEAIALEITLQELSQYGSNGASKHLASAVDFLNKGDWKQSISESIHAVECVAKALVGDEKASLGKALKQLEKNGVHIHASLEEGLSKIYGYTSNEKGIRHAEAFGNDDTVDVDETDALFMFGACASFVGYLLRKGKGAGLLDE